MPELLSVAEAQRLVLNAFTPTKVESLALHHAMNRVLAHDISADRDLPSFDNSGMDGFAVRAIDTLTASQELPVELKVIADIPAGEVVHVSLQAGQAARIMTGAQIPSGSDAVIPVEDTDCYGLQTLSVSPAQVKIYKAAHAGDYIRPTGQDVRVGEIILHAGNRLRPQDIGLLAMLGKSEILVHRLPRVALLSSGDELVPVGTHLTPGKVYDSNSFTLTALLDKCGVVAIPLGVAADRLDAVEALLEKAVQEQVGLIVTSAGVSVGAFDYVRAALEKHGQLGFWRVNMRPGKPLTFGNYRGIPFIGLPGNPVSAFIGFEVFIRPALNRLSGLPDDQRETVLCVISEAIESDGRESYLRAIIHNEDGVWKAKLTGHQGSGNLHSLVQANALLLLPSGVKSLPVGSEVKAWII